MRTVRPALFHELRNPMGVLHDRIADSSSEKGHNLSFARIIKRPASSRSAVIVH
jgi:hypothetical protein